MSQNENTIDPANTPRIEFADTVNINKIAGEEIFITGYSVNRGTPNDYTNADDIGEDGKTEYRTITTEQSFDLEHKGETKSINHFYVPKAVGKQVARFENEINSGQRFGPVKAIKRPKTDNPSQSYWALANKSDDDYE